ncbi:MAG TPA: CPBP family intramembrane glutamic endopeptidase [Acidobacteriaceae bacterium]
MSNDEVSAAEQHGMTAGAGAIEPRPRVIAPWWHTVLVLVQLMAVALIGPRSVRSRMDMPHVALYTVAVMSTWLQLGAVVAGVYRRRRFFFDTLQRGVRSWWVDAQRGLVVYLATLLMFAMVAAALHRLGLHPGFDREVLMMMAPNSWLELLMWLGVCGSVGFCEEHVFRGYLLQQMIAWGAKAGASPRVSASIAVVVTSVLFGSLHVYEGVGGAVLIACLGAMYAVVALRLGNLRAVIVAHVLQDFLAFVMIMTRHLHGA